MLLYQHADGHYLVVPPSMRFAPAGGYSICFDGQDVPDVICAAYLRESGGSLLRESDEIEMRGPTEWGVSARPHPRRRVARRRGGVASGRGWRRRLSHWLQLQPIAG